MKSKKVTLGLLIFYLIALTWIILFKLQFSFEDLPNIRNINLIPFGESVITNGKINATEILQNVLAFIPLGVFVHALGEEKSWLVQIVPVICTSLLYEVFQFIFSIGATDITDLISNSSGGVIGIVTAIAISKLAGEKWIKSINIISLIGAVLLTVFIAVLLLANM